MYGIVYQTVKSSDCGPRRRTIVFGEKFSMLWRARLAAARLPREMPCIKWARVFDAKTGRYVSPPFDATELGPDFDPEDWDQPVPVEILNRFDRLFAERAAIIASRRNPLKRFPNMS